MAFINSHLIPMFPSAVERKGSLSLRCDHMKYSNSTLNSNWHEVREAHPKDYDITQINVQNLHRATYDRILDVTNGQLLTDTSSQIANEQLKQKKSYSAREIHKRMVNKDNFTREIENDRFSLQLTGTEVNSILPHHNPLNCKQNMTTTNGSDFLNHTPIMITNENVQTKKITENATKIYTKYISSFSETEAYRIPGINTFHDVPGNTI